jgi:chaperonin GroES
VVAGAETEIHRRLVRRLGHLISSASWFDSYIFKGGQEQMAVNITPLHDRILVKRIEEKETVKGGIIVPDTAKEKSQEGEVIAVGAGKLYKGKRIPVDVQVGDHVLIGKYSGTDIKIEDEEYLILREEDVLAKIGKAAKAAGRG